MKNLNFMDSHLSLIIPGMLANAYGVFLLRQFIKVYDLIQFFNTITWSVKR